ncbi:MAG: hypothetical protein LBP21_02530 [Synergistaceae bacterium]|jgi:hypothetical protein|nr:hypothetical protein [Synergistaceae bacterium]
MIFSRAQELKALTTRSSLTVLLRAFYRMGLDYCVLPPSDGFGDIIVFTKDQLVSLIERNSEASILDISRRVAQGLFKPVAIFKSDASSSDFVSKGGFADPEKLQVLVVDEEGASVSSLKEALIPRTPNFPEWWEAPIPFALFERGKTYINRTAMLMFGPDLKRIATDDLPDKNEFLVTLEGKGSPCTVTFRRLEGTIFMLDDCTSDAAAAADIAWWAAVGKAWSTELDAEKRVHRRCGKEEAESLRANHIVLTCEWEGELLGYFCVEKTARKIRRSPATLAKDQTKTGIKEKGKEKEKTGEKETRRSSSQSSPKSSSQSSSKSSSQPSSEKNSGEDTEDQGNETLRVLGPQAMGLLAPGLYPSAPEESDHEELDHEKFDHGQ